MAERLEPGAELGPGAADPLVMARTLPCCSVIRVTIRSASPRRMVRSTMPRSRNRVTGSQSGSGCPVWVAVPGAIGLSGPRGGVGPRAWPRPPGAPVVPPPAQQVAGADQADQDGRDETRGAPVNPATP